MGVVNSTFYVTSEEQSSSSEDDDFTPGTQKFTKDYQRGYYGPHPEEQAIRPTYGRSRTITIQTIAEIEKSLDIFEKVSLVYLLYDEAKIALERLEAVRQDQHSEVLVEWARHSMQFDNWQQKLLEALSLIQNYQVIFILGYEKSEAQEQFLPFNKSTSVIDGTKRSLYNLCDNLTKGQIEDFLFVVKYDFGNKRKFVYREFDPKYLEIYISYWMAIEYISPTDLTNLYRILKATGNYEVADNIKLLAPNSIADSSRASESGAIGKVLTPNSNTSSSREGGAIRKVLSPNSNGNSSRESGADDCCNNEHFLTRDQIHNDEKCYTVDSKFPGICLIINQEEFYTECEKSLEDRLAPDVKTETLAKRIGTNLDCDKLSCTFGTCGFTVLVRHNFKHDEMEREIQNVVNMVDNHSSLIVCILSHGSEGVVYGVNSIAVEVADIRNKMCKSNPNLNGKPKILIVQSCQGNNLQLIATDGANNIHSGIIPQAPDMLVFYATVPGYAALRSPIDGSWFIQSLCEAISENDDREHFEDLCISIQHKVCSKVWKTNEGVAVGMTPVKESTLRKKFYLPEMKRPNGH